MKIINNILKTIVYLTNSFCVFYFIVCAMLLYEFNITYSITLSMIAILYIYLTYLFCKNTFLNEENFFKISISIIISIIMLVSIFIDINHISPHSISLYGALTLCSPYVILLISVKFNELYMKKLKN